MLFEYINILYGVIKLLLYKIIYPLRISFKIIPKMNKSFNISIKKNSKLILGKNFRSRNNISFRIYNSGKVIIGNNCFMNDNCSINCQEKITIGNNVIFGQNVMIFDHDHDYQNNINNFKRKEIYIGNDVWIGANCIILKGVSIGDNAVIAAGTIVRENVSNNSIVHQKRKTIIRKFK